MIDVSNKPTTKRTAVAEARLTATASTIRRVVDGQVPKGNALETAKIAAIQGAKNTPLMLPYCHPMPIDFVGVEFEVGETSIDIRVTVTAVHKTGVEMEALTGASVAALTIYDMLKFTDEPMSIEHVRLVSKRGGKSDFKTEFTPPLRAAVLVLSDTVAAGTSQDRSGMKIRERLDAAGVEVVDFAVIPDEQEDIRNILIHYCDELKLDVVLTTGGTGIGPRDRTPEAMKQVIEKEVPGISETIRGFGQARMPYSMLSRGMAGTRGNTLIVNFPGSTGGVQDSLDAALNTILHAVKMIRGARH